MATYVGHVQLRCRRQRYTSLLIWIELLLQGITTTAILNVVIANSTLSKAIAASLSSVSLILAIYSFRMRPADQLKEAFRLEEEQWHIKEQYSALLLDYTSNRLTQDAAESRHEEMILLRKTIASGQMLTNNQFDMALTDILKTRPVWMSVFEWEMIRAPFQNE